MNVTFLKIIISISYFVSLFLIIYWMIYYIEKRSEINRDKNREKPVLKKFPFTTIVIPAYNGEYHVIKTINSVIKLEYPPDRFEVIVINDGSKDQTEKIVKDYIKKYDKKNSGNDHVSLRLINQPCNMGKAEALNEGVRLAKGEYFICIDADSTVDSDALLYMMDMFERDKKLAIATPVMKVYDPETWLQKFQRLEYMSSALIVKLMGYMNANYVAPGPFSVYKLSVLRKLGKFDGKYNIEDQEIAWRAQKHNYKIRQCSRAFVYTVAPRNLKSFTRQRTRWFRGSLLTMYSYRDMTLNKKYGDFGLFQIPLMISSYLLSLLALVLFGYYIVKPLIRQIYNWFLVNFDIFSNWGHWTFNFNILDIQITQVMIIYLVLFINIVLLYLASRMSKDKVRKYGSIHIIPYFFLYYVILGVILVKSLFEITIHKKQKW
jgi:cellulose synthase/poly-beta-1,6-N-acetylglucosamine synthase-like glycosyltransferase